MGAISRLGLGIACAATCASLSGCTIVRVEGASKAWMAYPGILRIEPAAEADLLTVRTSGVGLVPTIGGVHLGYARQTAAWVFDGSRCQVILFELPRGPTAAAELTRSLQDLPNACRTGGEDHDEAQAP